MRYEYTVVPAPTRGEKAKGARTPSDRFALSLTAALNRMAAEGWDYVRAETLPTDERSGLTGRSTVYHNVLIFRRAAPGLDTANPPASAAAPQPEYPVSASPAQKPQATPELPQAAAPLPDKPGPAPAVTSKPAPVMAPAGAAPTKAAGEGGDNAPPATPPAPRVSPAAD